jgi:hypothetical protein
MKKLHLILLFFITFNAHSQQLSFQELLSSSKSTNTFERTMFSQGNTPINISDYVAWGYATKNSNGSSTIPLTNDKTLESGYKYKSGEFISNEDFWKKHGRNGEGNGEYLKESKQVEFITYGYSYMKDSLIRVDKHKVHEAEFGHNYDELRSTASTFYEFKHIVHIDNWGEGDIVYEVTSLDIQFNSKSDYENIIKEIARRAEYIKTSNYLGVYKSEYLFIMDNLTCEISHNKGINNNNIGHVLLKWFIVQSKN